MHSYIPRVIAVLATIASVHASGQLVAIYEPQCSADQVQGDLTDCQSAVNAAWGLGHGSIGTHTNGCVNVVTSGKCRIDLCDINNDKSTVDYGAIATAAQIQLALCRAKSDTLTGGKTILEGFQQPGQAHSVATVYMNNDNEFVTPNHRAVRDRGVAAAPAIAVKETRAFEPEWNGIWMDVGRTFWRVEYQTQFSDDYGGMRYFLTEPVRNALIDGLVNNWIDGFSTQRRVGSSFEFEYEGYRYNIAITARDRQMINGIPFVDRRPIIETFLTMHRGVGNPRTFEGYLRYTDLNNMQVAMLTLMVNPVQADTRPMNWILFNPGSGM
ncbi:hypothetical protein E8E14_009478 [Neopestalotiopsis sp. 37M]|nr:hypothetical protein E8E14_009478 [Neopestalotiopsis sp. 37M]